MKIVKPALVSPPSCEPNVYDSGHRSQEHSINTIESLADALRNGNGSAPPSSRRTEAGLRRYVHAVDTEMNDLEGGGSLTSKAVTAAKDYIGNKTGWTYWEAINLPDTPSETPCERSKELVVALMSLLQKVKSPVLNATNIVARTGLIVALAATIREAVSYELENAMRSADTSESTRAWAAAGALLLGPGLNLLGMVRDELGGVATLQTRMARLCMSGIALGAWIAAHLSGASKELFAPAIGNNAYVFSRDLLNAFFPLQDNAGAPVPGASVAATGIYGMTQTALEEIAAWLPSSGAARAAAGLEYSIVADMLKGALISIGAVIDDTVYAVLRHRMPKPQDAAQVCSDEVFQETLCIRTSARLPGLGQLTDQLLTNGTLRCAAIQAITAAVGASAAWLTAADHGEDKIIHLLSLCVGAMVMLIYLPFVYGCQQRSNSWTLPSSSKLESKALDIVIEG